MTRVLPDTPVPYSPVLCAPFVIPPTLMIVAADDEMPHANYDVARLTHQLMPDPKEWHDIAGGHFGLLHHPSPLFDEASDIPPSSSEPAPLWNAHSPPPHPPEWAGKPDTDEVTVKAGTCPARRPSRNWRFSVSQPPTPDEDRS